MQAQVRVDCALSLFGFNSANRLMFFLVSCCYVQEMSCELEAFVNRGVDHLFRFSRHSAQTPFI